jgi:hypothetical protein
MAFPRLTLIELDADGELAIAAELIRLYLHRLQQVGPVLVAGLPHLSLAIARVVSQKPGPPAYLRV